VSGSNDNVASAGALIPQRAAQRTTFSRLIATMRRLVGASPLCETAEANEAVAYFLDAMTAVAARTYPCWHRTLNEALADCSLGFDDRRSLFEIHPVDDYYFAAVVALEAAKLRTLYTPQEASELLSEIGLQVDARSGRHDRVVSDLVFHMIGRIDLGAGRDRMKAPYDKVVKVVLQHMGLQLIEATRPLMKDVGLRHMLGEPLALGVPQWWRAFHTQFRIHWDEPEPVYINDDDLIPDVPVGLPTRRRPRRRAVAF
jgi:hypothetical protein